MATAAKKPTKATQTQHRDATAILRADHDAVSDLFDEFEAAKSKDKKQALALKICNELTIHARIEEEIFYPAVKQALGEDATDLLSEALVEHQSLKVLIGDIEDSAEDDELFDARVKVLGEYVKHHVKEEEGELFPQARDSDLDMAELGSQLTQRKQELKNELKGG